MSRRAHGRLEARDVNGVNRCEKLRDETGAAEKITNMSHRIP